MKVLVIGGGGREHSLVWKIGQSPKVEKIYCIPGNAGIAQIAECQSIDFGKSFDPLIAFVKDQGIDLTVVGPEAPLVAGLVDAFQAEGLWTFGPYKRAAEIEGSKIFAKNLMRKYNIPTARFRVFYSAEDAKQHLKQCYFPLVVKADGLAAGKGSIVCHNAAEGLAAVERIMVAKEFGAAGDGLIIEEYLKGEEVSFIVLTDGDHILPLASAQDHKPAYDRDKGPNTGGMGAYSPAPVVTAGMERRIMQEIIEPTVKAMAQEGRSYQGVLYAGLMMTEDGPKVLEFNCRFGDPESQPTFLRLKTDLVPLLEACLDGTLDQVELEWVPKPAVCVVMASGGYPDKYEKGKVISGLEAAVALNGVVVFHAGTAKQGDAIVTSGGRVLGVTAIGKDIARAMAKAYEAVYKIHFNDVHFRCDIGHRAFGRL